MNTIPETKPALPALVSGGQIRAIIPQDFDQAWRIASAISKAGMQPPGLETPEKITIAILAGLEVGLPPMQAIQSIAVINNRPSIYGDGMLALVRSSGLLEMMDEFTNGQGDEMTATCAVRRRGEASKVIRTFSVADAKKAGLWDKKSKNGGPTPWTHYPLRMLAMRARAFALRDAFADVLRGLAIAEEMEDIKPALRPPPPPPEDAIPDFGESVVKDAVESDPSLDVSPGGSSSQPSHVDAAAASSVTASFSRSDAIGKMLVLAGDADISADDKLEILDQRRPDYAELLGEEFTQALLSTTAKIIKGELKPAAGKKYLEAL